MDYIIENIFNRKTMQTRIDGRYPSRIGSTVKLPFTPVINCCFFWEYVKDNQGNHKTGECRTSLVTDYGWKNNRLYVFTYNSIYVFKPEGAK